LCPLNQPGQLDELGAFLGASYFRLLGKGQHYGESARGLALDCGEPIGRRNFRFSRTGGWANHSRTINNCICSPFWTA